MTTDDSTDDFRELLAHPAYDRPSGLTAEQLHRDTYRRLRRLRSAVGPAADLLADRARLCDLASWTAIRDPALFHALLVHYTLCLNGIAKFAADPAAALARLERDGDTGVLLLTEAGRSGSHRTIRTEARFDPATGEFVLHTPSVDAVKFPTATAADSPKTALVHARLITGGVDCGVFCFAVPLGGGHGIPPGLVISPAPEVATLPSDYAAVAFDHVRLPFTAWLSDGATIDEAGRCTDPLGSPEARLRRSMSPGAETWLALTAASAGMARAASAIAIRYSLTRTTSDALAAARPVLDCRNQHVELLGALADALALTTLTDSASKGSASDGSAPTSPTATDTTEPSRPTAVWAPWSAVDPLLPLFKAVAVDTAERVAASCRERCGAPAYVGTPLLMSYLSAAHAYRSAGGDNTLIRLDTARNMAANAGYEPPADDPPPALDTGEDFLDLARSCEHRLHALLRDRLAAAREGGEDEFTAWNDRSELALDTAGVYAERLLMERFAVGADPDLLLLHGVSWLRRRAGALLRCGLIGPTDLDTAERIAHEACDRLLPRAAVMVDAFGVDQAFTGTFMAADDYLSAFAAEFGLHASPWEERPADRVVQPRHVNVRNR
ncbi:acyl-CoA dehydrogenase [Glycomyces sp. NRRL B-16210]|uniref:acyl-CoA dehydrogenase family protein n=1 Tax=Glycomyces sp. NRRL B-16210 TaxID=1463821 RepID=UPI00068B25F7|nr:acyl-CoA dehydrogenase [Glycomyces sp. NRRL B-16210]